MKHRHCSIKTVIRHLAVAVFWVVYVAVMCLVFIGAL